MLSIGAQWNALDGGGNPFVRHEFLAALEHTQLRRERDSGWEPRYLALRDAHGLAAAATAFVKTHSYGEFVFDFAWAQAYERLGRHYYPKLTLATPFTPATGTAAAGAPRSSSSARPAARLLEELEALHRESRLLGRARAVSRRAGARGVRGSAAGCCGATASSTGATAATRASRTTCESFTADKRKKARRERRRVAEAGVRFETRFGDELDRGAARAHLSSCTATLSCGTATSRI